jgi:hypothetical protein
MLTTTRPDAAKNGPGSRPGVSRPAAPPVALEHHPVVLAEQARRVSDIQLRIADRITAFAGSMNFVYLHAVLFTAPAGWARRWRAPRCVPAARS